MRLKYIMSTLLFTTIIGMSGCEVDGEENFSWRPGNNLHVLGSAEVEAGTLGEAYYVDGFTVNETYNWQRNGQTQESERGGEFVYLDFLNSGEDSISVSNGTYTGRILIETVPAALSGSATVRLFNEGAATSRIILTDTTYIEDGKTVTITGADTVALSYASADSTKSYDFVEQVSNSDSDPAEKSIRLITTGTNIGFAAGDSNETQFVAYTGGMALDSIADYETVRDYYEANVALATSAVANPEVGNIYVTNVGGVDTSATLNGRFVIIEITEIVSAPGNSDFIRFRYLYK